MGEATRAAEERLEVVRWGWSSALGNERDLFKPWGGERRNSVCSGMHRPQRLECGPKGTLGEIRREASWGLALETLNASEGVRKCCQ